MTLKKNSTPCSALSHTFLLARDRIRKKDPTPYLRRLSLTQGTHNSYMFDFESRDSEYITISANLAYPCFHLRWDVSSHYLASSTCLPA